MNATRTSNRRPGRSIAVGLVVILLGFLLVAAQLMPATYKGATYKCRVEGPSSPMAAMSERSDVVTGYPALWPVGRACEWDRSAGGGTITTYSGSWAGTLVALGLLVGGAAVVVIAFGGLPKEPELLESRAR